MSLRLHSERLELRDVQIGDVSAIAEYEAAHRYNHYLPRELPTIDKTRRRVELFRECASGDTNRPRFLLIAELKRSGPVIGELTLARSSRSVAEIGWGLAPTFWSNGFGTEMAERALIFGFEELGLHRIEARVTADNQASVRILEKLGFSCEGVTRECVWARGRWWSLARYGLIEHEFADATK